MLIKLGVRGLRAILNYSGSKVLRSGVVTLCYVTPVEM